MIIISKAILLIFFISFSFSEINFQFYQESKIASGETIKQGITESYIINENIFDLGLGYNQFYLHTQLEYSEDPFLGEPKTDLKDIVNNYYLEYLGDKLNLKIGNIYSQYTRGLILNTYQDQSTDFDNSITGLELGYDITDWLRFYSVYGTDTYEFRAHPINQVNDFSHDHSLIFLGSEFSYEDFIFNIQYMHQELIIDDSINITDNLNYSNSIDFYSAQETFLGDYISNNYYSVENSFYCTDLSYSNQTDCELESNGYCSNSNYLDKDSCESNGYCSDLNITSEDDCIGSCSDGVSLTQSDCEYFDGSCSDPTFTNFYQCSNTGNIWTSTYIWSTDIWTSNIWINNDWLPENGFESDEISKYKITSDMLGLSAEGYFLGFDLYAEYVAAKYTKLTPSVESGELIDGSMFYGSVSRDIFDLGITYEFKRYDMPYFIRTVSFAPFVYREATSVLQSRLSHNMNFSNEIGHQLDLLYPISDNFMFNFNISTARRIDALYGIHYNYNRTHNFDANTFLEELNSTDPADMDEVFNNLSSTDEENNYWEVSESSVDTSYYEYSETPNIMSLLFMDKDESLYSFFPYRQLYAGINGYLFDDRLYFNLGIDLFEHIKNWGKNNQGTIYQPGMTHNVYDNIWLDDEEDLNSQIGFYINQYYDDNFVLDDYWYYYDIYLQGYNNDISGAEEYAESIVGFNPETRDSLISTYQQSALDSLDSYRSNFRSYYKWDFENENAITIPTQFSWNIGGGRSVLLYFEKQWRTIEKNGDKSYSSGPPNSSGTTIEDFDELYLSLSFKNKNNTITLYHNYEMYTIMGYESGNEVVFSDNNSWNGVEWTINFKSIIQSNDRYILYTLHNTLLSNSRLSMFYGSQKGGLVCANGICATQPEFLNGIKLSFTRTF